MAFGLPFPNSLPWHGTVWRKLSNSQLLPWDREKEWNLFITSWLGLPSGCLWDWFPPHHTQYWREQQHSVDIRLESSRKQWHPLNYLRTAGKLQTCRHLGQEIMGTGRLFGEIIMFKSSHGYRTGGKLHTQAQGRHMNRKCLRKSLSLHAGLVSNGLLLQGTRWQVLGGVAVFQMLNL